ncbi:hypothetical protein [Actinoplanes sp. NBRC 103695]|uniref:hypothetical protein n=1 Tax=Actinoplanes sp. NBRC 103695 TaxID=3032202 RepID=UPI0024A43D8B|nr:hypothetical protein [Actinoplanes sp. NBRC 103695]GLY95733.1 hypothetical protein Acsp02_29880 [Actinoplanes sp. NBRC 103695]
MAVVTTMTEAIADVIEHHLDLPVTEAHVEELGKLLDRFLAALASEATGRTTAVRNELSARRTPSHQGVNSP